MKAYVQWATDKYPNVPIYLLGHSEGTYVALQVAHEVQNVKGVALIGFFGSSLETISFEQFIYRPLEHFTALDENRDEVLNEKELSSKNPIAEALRQQSALMDLNADQHISLSEFKAANFSNLLIRDFIGNPYRQDQASYPQVGEILSKAHFKVLFLQGMWDNQTPAYNTQGVEMANKMVWKKDTFQFVYFPKLGHALDPRDNYVDIIYRPVDPEALKEVGKRIHSFFDE